MRFVVHYEVLRKISKANTRSTPKVGLLTKWVVPLRPLLSARDLRRAAGTCTDGRVGRRNHGLAAPALNAASSQCSHDQADSIDFSARLRTDQ